MNTKTQRSPLSKVGGWVTNNINLVFLIVMVIVGIVASENFFQWDNLMNLFRRITVNGIMAVGFTMTLLVGGFDLSIGSTMSLCAVLLVGVGNSTQNFYLALLVCVAAGLAMGLLNGFLMKLTRGGSGEAFLITLATGMVAASLAKHYCNGSELYYKFKEGVGARVFEQIGQGSVLTLPICALIWIVLMIIFQIIIKKTKLGRNVLLTGANKNSAYLSGVNVGALKVMAFAIAGVMSAFAAVIMASRTTGASPNSGAGGDFDAAIASIIGGNSLVGGKGGMVQVLIGAIIYGLITNILNLMGVASVVQYIVKGCVLLLAICLDNLKKR